MNAGNYFRPMSLGQLTFLLNYLNTLFQLAYQKTSNFIHWFGCFLSVCRFDCPYSTFHFHYVNLMWSVSTNALVSLSLYTLCQTHTTRKKETHIDQQKRTHTLSSPLTCFFLLIGKTTKKRNDAYNLSKSKPFSSVYFHLISSNSPMICKIEIRYTC